MRALRFDARTAICSLSLVALQCWVASPLGASEGAAPLAPSTIRGKVLWIGDALQRLHNVRVAEDAGERMLVLETEDGQLHPLIEDTRGRAFRRDERLRGVPVELLVRRHRGTPLVQVIRVYALEGSNRLELDYWCEICAIAMFELKACDCCQGPIELRRRKQ